MQPIKVSQKTHTTAVVYCRVSSKDQVDGTSLEVQERTCREYAERQDIEVMQVFIERGESAKTTERTEFTKAIAFCTNKKQKVDYFIVYKLDRFARNQDDHVTVRALLRKAGTELRSVTEPISDTTTGRMMEGIISVFAEFDNNVRTERTRSGMLSRLRQGVWCWAAPLGYQRLTSKGNITPDQGVAPLIRLAFEEYAKGTYTYKSLAEFLTARELRTKCGKKVIPQLVEKILKNPLYYGSMQVWGEKVKGAFEPIVSQELFEACQEGYRKNSNNHARPHMQENPSYPLRGYVRCTECKNTLTASSPRGGRGQHYPYYHHRTQDCSKSRFIRKDTFEKNFVTYLDELTPSPQRLHLIDAIVRETWKERIKKVGDESAKVRREIKQLEEQRQSIFDFHRLRKYSDEEFFEQKEIVSAEMTRKQHLLQEVPAQEGQPSLDESVKFCLSTVGNTSKFWLHSTPEIRTRFQHLVFRGKNLTFNGERFGTTDLSLIYKLNGISRHEKSHLVPLVGQMWNQLTEELHEWLMLKHMIPQA